MMVKICGITTRDDARAAADLGASAIGLNFYRLSPRYVTSAQAASIAQAIPANILKVGVFVDDDQETIATIAREAGLDVAQLHGGSQSSLPSWRAVPVRNTIDLTEFQDPQAEAFLLDTASGQQHGGTGQTFPWSLARHAARLTGKRIIVAGGLDETNVQAAIAEAQPWGVDVCSRIESAPGVKDHRKMEQFIQAALTAEKS